jgi:hypothetical protein
MAPTLCRAPGAQGHRPTAAARDGKGLLYAFPAVTAVTVAPHADTPEGTAGAARKAGRSKARRPQGAFAAPCGTSAGSTPRAGTGGWCHSSATPLPRLRSADGGAGGQPSPGIEAAAAVRPAAEAVLGGAAPAGDAQLPCDSLAGLQGSIRNSLRHSQAPQGQPQTLLNGFRSPQPERTISPGL